MPLPLIVPLAMAAAGAIAGSQKDVATKNSQRNLGPAGELENLGMQAQTRGIQDFQSFVGLGAGGQDVTSGVNAQRSLADMLKQFSQGGFLPSAQDNTTAQNFAQTQFAPQNVMLQQSFEQQQLGANQLAAQMGRGVNDPIIQAKLRQEQMRQQQQLDSQQGAFGSQFAMQLPQQRLGYASQFSDVSQNLASQAMSNRQALVSMGSQIASTEFNKRLSQAGITETTESGGGLKGGIEGGISGFGAGMGMGGLFKDAPTPNKGGANSDASGGSYGSKSQFGNQMMSDPMMGTSGAAAKSFSPLAGAANSGGTYGGWMDNRGGSNVNAAPAPANNSFNWQQFIPHWNIW